MEMNCVRAMPIYILTLAGERQFHFSFAYARGGQNTRERHRWVWGVDKKREKEKENGTGAAGSKRIVYRTVSYRNGSDRMRDLVPMIPAFSPTERSQPHREHLDSAYRIIFYFSPSGVQTVRK